MSKNTCYIHEVLMEDNGFSPCSGAIKNNLIKYSLDWAIMILITLMLL
jgi:hypothetical protein